MNTYLTEFLLYFGVIVITIIGAFIAELVDKKKEKKMDWNSFVVRQSVFSLYKWLTLTFLFITLGVLMRISQIGGNDTIPWSMYPTVLVFGIFGVGMVADYIRWKVRISGRNLYHHRLFSFRIIAFNEIKSIQLDGQKNCVLLGLNDEKLLFINSTCRGYARLMYRLEQEEIAIVPFDEGNRR